MLGIQTNVLLNGRKEEIYSNFKNGAIPPSLSSYMFGMLNGDMGGVGWLVGFSEAANSMLAILLLHIIQAAL